MGAQGPRKDDKGLKIPTQVVPTSTLESLYKRPIRLFGAILGQMNAKASENHLGLGSSRAFGRDSAHLR